MAALLLAALPYLAVGGGGAVVGGSGGSADHAAPAWARLPTDEHGRTDELDGAERERLRLAAKEMFYHGYDSYMNFAFPHDELQPLTLTWADTLEELGDATRDPSSTYDGVALTLIDSLDTLGVMGNATEFTRGVNWVCRNVSFHQDVRVNLFELNIRVLGGLLSAHYLAGDPKLGLMLGQDYDGCLLDQALDVANRMLPAFDTATRIPQPWINLAKGSIRGDSRTQCTAGCGTLLLEFGLLSRLTGNATFHTVALEALQALWSRRSSIGLLGNTLDYGTGRWTNENAGIGAGVDSFYEYLLKSYLVFDSPSLWTMWEEAYGAARKYLKHGPWYVQSHMRTGRMVHQQFESLQAFWPALQVLAGDVGEAIETHDAFFSLWTQYGFLPESYLLVSRTVHPSMKYYPLRPELAESTYALYRATRDPYYLRQGEQMLSSLNGAPRVAGGFATVKDVKNPRLLEDRMASFFLSETCKYLYLLFDEDSFVHADPDRHLIFNTEGHLIPVLGRLKVPRSGTARGNLTAEAAAGAERAGVDETSLWDKAAQAVAGAADAIKAKLPLKTTSSANREPQTCPNKGRLEQAGAGGVYRYSGNRESWLPPKHQRAKVPDVTAPVVNNVCRPQQQKKPAANGNSNSNVLQVEGVEVQAGDGVFASTQAIPTTTLFARTPLTDCLWLVLQKLKDKSGEAMVFRVMPNVGVEMSHSDGNSAYFYLFRPLPGATDTVSVAPVASVAAGAGKDAVTTAGGTKSVDMTVTGFYVKLVTGQSPGSGSATHTFPASNSLFGPKTDLEPARHLVEATPLDGCAVSKGAGQQQPAAFAPGSILLVERGSCAFVSKVHAAQEAGASAVIVINNQRAELFMMGGDGTARQGAIRIPSVMVSAESGAAIRAIISARAAKCLGTGASCEAKGVTTSVVASFGEHQFNLDGQMKDAQQLGLRTPLASGSVSAFEFHGAHDFGLKVNRLVDGNYQLMLIGQRVSNCPPLICLTTVLRKALLD